jgi:hypothetical protein
MNTTKRRSSLSKLLRRLALSLPPPEAILRGSVFVRRRRCGGSGCRCAKGPGHATAYLVASLPGGRTVQISLPPGLVPEARRRVAIYRRWWRSVERISAINRELFRRRWIDPLKPAAQKRKT